MTPYYSDDYVTIYYADFRTVDADPRLVIADPPFNLWNIFADDIAALQAKTCVAFTNWQNREPLMSWGVPRAELVWTFADGRWTSHNLPRTCHESILVYGEVGPAYVGRPMSHVEPVRKGAGSVGRDRMPERVWRPRDRALLDSHLPYARDVSRGVWSKPPPLMEQLIEWLCPPDGLVFDPFTGTGSALKAAKNLGRRAIGCDTDESQCERAALRCSQDTLGLSA